MTRKTWIKSLALAGLIVVSAAAGAQAKKGAKKKVGIEKKVEAKAAVEAEATPAAGEASLEGEVADEAAAPEPAPEGSLEACQDQVDNDLDGHIDCADQDCEVFAACVTASTPETVEEAPAEPVMMVAPPPLPERAWQCKDGIDNDENGLVDCHESACQISRYCKRKMYERPEPPEKVPGVFINFGFGLALPNYDVPTAETRSDDYGRVPFDPDIGLMLDFQAGYLFLKWLGAGINFKYAATFASNRERYYVEYDTTDNYKYVGTKFWGNLGGFVRFQWPFKRVVPHLSLHVGYSSTKYRWHIYDPDNSWNDVVDYESDEDNNYIEGERDERTVPDDGGRSRHFLFALEPGFDAFVIKRLFGVGMRVWLPVVANENSSYDNVGVLLSFTFTPTWREAPRLKSEYAKAK
jgi:hypothetical protein